jgi:site-specific recombinase XerD
MRLNVVGRPDALHGGRLADHRFRAKICCRPEETLLELLGARVRNPNTRSAYRVAWRSFLAFCSARRLELESVKAYQVGSWLDQHPGSRSTQRQHLAAVRLLFDSLMMRGVVEYNPAARAKPPRLVRESSHTPSLKSLKSLRSWNR